MGFVLQQPARKFSCELVCADVHICQERLWWWDMLLCCCGVGAPLGLSVLVSWFPAAQHFAGPRGDTEGTYDWAMQSWASRSYRSATDTSLLASFCLFIVSPLLSTAADMATSLMFLSMLVSSFRSLTFQSWWLQSRCTCCHKGKMDISAHLSQQITVLT